MIIMDDGEEDKSEATSSKLSASDPGYRINVPGLLHTAANSGFLSSLKRRPMKTLHLSWGRHAARRGTVRNTLLSSAGCWTIYRQVETLSGCTGRNGHRHTFWGRLQREHSGLLAVLSTGSSCNPANPFPSSSTRDAASNPIEISLSGLWDPAAMQPSLASLSSMLLITGGTAVYRPLGALLAMSGDDVLCIKLPMLIEEYPVVDILRPGILSQFLKVHIGEDHFM